MISDYDKKLAEIIHRHLPGFKAYLFGLKLKDVEYYDLEMDIALDMGETIDPAIIGNIYFDIKKELLPITVHIVDINNMSDFYRKKILSKGVLLHN
ncbi:nucleotidyltransferase domain-containing protein [Candidatus Babeliales bacterium]|nr:nucleotidyltransferase domain-containing protein [Candidatus Babeliales bacterium]MCF7899354.1 nucleotidyltransferase domain-containing protein [Candidatus Babeliales bacterium]